MDKVRAKAEKAGVSTVGAVVGGGNAGVESYPVASITSASVRQSGVWAFLTFTSSNVDVEFRGDVQTVPAARAAIMAAKAEAV